jgi:hypothetical protein
MQKRFDSDHLKMRNWEIGKSLLNQDFLIYWVLNYFEGINKSSTLRKFANFPISHFQN